MRNFINKIIIYYLSYYSLVNLLLQLVFIFKMTSFFNFILELDNKNKEEFLIKTTLNYLVKLFSTDEKFIRFYGIIEMNIFNRPKCFITQFYIDYISNKEVIHEFLKQVRWQPLMLQYNNLNDIHKNVLDQYIEHIQIVEKETNRLLLISHTLPEIKNTCLFALNKHLPVYRLTYLNSLNLLDNFDFERYIRTVDYQTNNMQILKNIYQNVVINIRPHYSELFINEFNYSIIEIRSFFTENPFLLYGLTGLFVWYIYELNSFTFDYETSLSAVATVPPIEDHLITPNLLDKLRQEHVTKVKDYGLFAGILILYAIYIKIIIG